jgi:hypothetical protein
MNINRKTGILSMGPLWDFDLAFGNVDYNDNDNPEGFWIKKTPWYTRLFKDPEFVKLVKEHFYKFYAYKDYYTRLIISSQSELESSAKYNYLKWYSNSSKSNPDLESSCNSLEDFMAKRWAWLKNEFDNL